MKHLSVLRFLATVTAVLVHFYANSSSAQFSQDDILSSWQSLEQLYTPIDGVVEVNSVTEVSGASSNIITKMKFKQLDDKHRLIISQDSQFDGVRCINPQYYFQLSPGDRGNPWFLSEIVDKSNQDSFQYRLEGQESGCEQFFPKIGLNTIFAALKSETIEIREIESVQPGELVRVHLIQTNSNVGPPFGSRTLRQTGEVVLDPINNFLPVSYDLKFSLDGEVEMAGTSSGKYEYTSEGFPTKISRLDRYDSKDVGSEVVLNYQIECVVSHAPHVKEADFRLPAFGLPEPREYTRSGVNWSYLGVFLIAAFGVLLLFRFGRTAVST